ncbi:MAG TPA: type VI secretion system tube protein Hcp [Aggregatilineales bacterium]|nr:type VI secretion system tube protein Hcp [Aggregatilineales bacterium]
MANEKKSDESDPREEQPEVMQPAEELSDDELNNLAGGKAEIHYIVITKYVDSSSPKLYQQ